MDKEEIMLVDAKSLGYPNEPKPNDAVEILTAMAFNEGYKVFVFSADTTDSDDIEKWVRKHKVSCDAIVTPKARTTKSYFLAELVANTIMSNQSIKFVISRSIALWAKLPDKKVFFWS